MNNGETPTNDLLSAYLDGEVTAAEWEVVERILAESPDARAELEDYERISEELRGLPDDAPPVDVRGAVLSGIRHSGAADTVAASTPGKRRRPWGSLLPLGIAGAVAACVLVAVGVRMTWDAEPLGMPVAGHARNQAPDRQMDTAAEAASEAAATAEPPAEARVMSAAPPAAATDAEARENYFTDDGNRLPEDVEAGDMYSYLNRTEEGDIVVVEAYVVDVRKAVDQIQVLLSRNQIPTAMVASRNAEGLNLATARPRNDLAVYVESEPERVKLALDDMRRGIGTPSNSIQGMQVAGVLDTPDVGMDERRLNYLELDARPFRQPDAGDRGPYESDAVPQLGEAVPQARGSVQDEMAPREETMGMRAFSGGAAPESVPEVEDSAAKEAPDEPSAETAMPRFQTVLNVSNSAITEVLRRQQATPAEPRDRSEAAEPAITESDETNAMKSYSFDIPGAVQRMQGTERRLRLLLVLQQRPEQEAVEAPRP